MQLYSRLIYYSKSALHVSGDVFAHHKEHLTVFTLSGSIYQCRCQLVSYASMTPAGSEIGEYYLLLLRGLTPRANYTDRAAAADRRS